MLVVKVPAILPPEPERVAAGAHDVRAGAALLQGRLGLGQVVATEAFAMYSRHALEHEAVLFVGWRFFRHYTFSSCFG